MNAWRAVFHPSVLARKWLRKEDGWSLKTKLELDWFPRPEYAYCLNQACIQAKGLGIEAISAIEFGIGEGDGLVASESLAAELSKANGVAIHTYGFDDPDRVPSSDPRDLPYLPPRGKVDRAAIDAKLKSTTLILGDLTQTVPVFFEIHDPPPIGFVSFRLNDYTTTAAALRLFEAASESRLPRAFTFFDNLIGEDEALHCEFAGELLAIEAFNKAHESLKLGRINGLRHKRVFQSSWTEQVFALHDFTHPRYGDQPRPEPDSQTPATP